MYKIITSVALSTLLMACGGGGSSSSTDPVVEPPTNPEPPVQETKDHSGLTPLTAENIDEKEHLAGGNATQWLTRFP